MHEQLLDAAEAVRDAADLASDGPTRDRLTDQAETLESLAERDPDHGRMARHERILGDVAGEAGDEVADAVEEALDSIRAYRETIEGV